ncbi:rCG27061 [Rattus norvegicus]|uniref:RCG27061 n=1 Tax=Rattus norvegicus TaxID=10116 RepID=A6HNR2_RAT|nr:rCG27061 [Rattus norvegicus]
MPSPRSANVSNKCNVATLPLPVLKRTLSPFCPVLSGQVYCFY